MALLCGFIGVAAPLALLGIAVSTLIPSVDNDAIKESRADNSDKDWVSIV